MSNKNESIGKETFRGRLFEVFKGNGDDTPAEQRKRAEKCDPHADVNNFGVGGSDCEVAALVLGWEETTAEYRQLQLSA